MGKPEATELDREHLLQAISAAQGFFIGHRDFAEIFDQLLVQLLSLTDSEYGYIGEVLQDEDGERYLRTQAISNIAWSPETRAFYEENAPTGLEFRNLNTLFGHVIAHEEVVISNDPASDPRAGGLPPGHPRLDAFLGLPIFADGELVGSAGLSNRPRGYGPEVAQFLEPFLSTCAQLMVAQRVRRSRRSDERRAKELVSVVSHELRTPMTAIRGALGLLVGLHGEVLPPDAAELVNMAYKGCERMLTLLDDLLDVHRLEAGEIQLNLDHVELMDLIRSCAEVFRSLAAEAGVSLHLGCDGPTRVMADEVRISQVLGNLIGNAIKFSPPSTEIHVTCRDSGDSICVDVRDTGTGIPEEELERIFEKFQGRADADADTRTGLGLGLYVARGLMQGHGGELRVQSELGVGTCFTMVFPRPWTHGPGPNLPPGEDT